MNFFNAQLIAEGEALFVDTGSFRVPVSPHHARFLRERNVPWEVTFGIRPEDIFNAACIPRGVADDAVIEVLVDVVELLGAERLLNLLSGPHTFTARMDNRTQARAGERLRVAFNMANMHFFDRLTERAYL
ncbi:MAG: TOBE domain-containing protein [Chloroflexia bacterium]